MVPGTGTLPGPAFLVVVSDNVLVVGVGMLRQIALDQVPRLLGREPNQTTITIIQDKMFWNISKFYYARQRDTNWHRCKKNNSIFGASHRRDKMIYGIDTRSKFSCFESALFLPDHSTGTVPTLPLVLG